MANTPHHHIKCVGSKEEQAESSEFLLYEWKVEFSSDHSLPVVWGKREQPCLCRHIQAPQESRRQYMKILAKERVGHPWLTTEVPAEKNTSYVHTRWTTQEWKKIKSLPCIKEHLDTHPDMHTAEVEPGARCVSSSVSLPEGGEQPSHAEPRKRSHELGVHLGAGDRWKHCTLNKSVCPL